MDFATPEAKNAAILMTESPLEGRRLLIKDGARIPFFRCVVRPLKNNLNGTGGNFEGRPVKPGVSLDDPGARGKGQSKFAQKVLSTQKQPPAPTLFFGNLGFETTTESIKGLLDAHRAKEKKKSETVRVASSESADNNNDDGDDDVAPKKDPWIRKIRMGTFEDSGLCKGYVTVPTVKNIFVHFENFCVNGRDHHPQVCVCRFHECGARNCRLDTPQESPARRT